MFHCANVPATQAGNQERTCDIFKIHCCQLLLPGGVIIIKLTAAETAHRSLCQCKLHDAMMFQNSGASSGGPYSLK